MKQCWRWVQPCAGKGGEKFPGVIRPKKECIKSCEICFANNLNLNDKGPSIEWVCSSKFNDPLAIWPWLRISPQSSLSVIYCLIISAWQWLMSFPYTPYIPTQIKTIKACQGKDQGSLFLREWPRCSKLFSPWESGCAIPFPPQDSVVPVNLSPLSHNAVDTACWWPRQLFIFKLKLLSRSMQDIQKNCPLVKLWGV